MATNLGRLLNAELNDYGIEYKIEAVDRDIGHYYCYVCVKFCNNAERHICFKVTDGEVEVELGRDCYEKCEEFKPSVKFLWMALLDYPEPPKEKV